MIAVIINRPLVEHGIRLLEVKYLLECLIVIGVHDCVAVALARVGGACLEKFAGLGGFGDARRCRGGRPSAIIQVEQDDLMAEGSEPGNCAATTVFRITGMSAGDDNL